MIIDLKPTRVHIGTAGKSGERRQAQEKSAEVIPARAHVNLIPEPESLATLIRSAVDAVRRGVFWDRGTILNLLV